MTDPAKLIAIMKVMLSELEQSLSTTPQEIQENDDATDHLKGRIDRLEAALKKREDHARRQRELEKQNRRNSGHP
jgi:septal ring factor EnvC (AmiA/AmiB activator)